MPSSDATLQRVGDPEITPEMIEAGAEIISRYDPDYDSPRRVAAAVFRAMLDQKSNGEAA